MNADIYVMDEEKKKNPDFVFQPENTLKNVRTLIFLKTDFLKLLELLELCKILGS